MSKNFKVFGRGEDPRLWEKPKSRCPIWTGTQQAGWAGLPSPGKVKLVGCCWPTKVMLRSAVFHHQSRPDKVLRVVLSTHIPQGQWLGTQEWEVCVARGPEAWGCSCWASFNPVLCYHFEKRANAYADWPGFIHSLHILELVYFKSLLPPTPL